MRKISNLLVSLFFLICIGGCAGYEPIFSSSLEIKIADYSILGDKKLSRQIYSRLDNLSRSTKESTKTKNLYVEINSSKSTRATVKDNAGKILEYRITLSTNILVKDYITENIILRDTLSFSSTYTVQSQQSKTMELRNQAITNLIDKSYQELLIKLSENLL